MTAPVGFGKPWLASLCVLALIAARTAPSAATTFDFCVDVPTLLGGVDYTPDQIVRRTALAYGLQAALPPGVEPSALHRRPDGSFLFAPSHPITLGGSDYEPRDLIAWNGVSFTSYLDGEAIGLPEGTRIDALVLDAASRPVMSFDAPVVIGGTSYGWSDLVRYDSGFSSWFDAAAAGVPAPSNVVGAGIDSDGVLVLTFDSPTRIGPTDYIPGELVSIKGASFSLYQSNPGWPASAELRDFAFLPPAGAVPDDDGLPGVPLTLTANKSSLVLSWGAGSCNPGDSDYEVYEGTIGGLFDSHGPRLCSTGGATTVTLSPGAGNTYYLVVPRNGVSEGSYGRRSDGSQRPQSTAACLPQVIASACR